MTRRPPPELPEHKPVAEMTLEERREYTRELLRITRQELAELNRPKRERKLRRGLTVPRNAAERELFCADVRDAGQREGKPEITAEQLPGTATAEDIARWMADCLERDGHLDQRDAAHELAGRFGERFTYLTPNNNLAISQRVLRAFRRAADGPSWDQRSLCWLPRTRRAEG